MLNAISTENTAPTSNATTSTAGTPASTVENAPMEARKPSLDSEYASQFAKLTAKERQLRNSEAELKSLREEVSKFKRLKDEAKLKPESVLSEYGLSYEELTKRMLEGGTDDKYNTIEQRIAKIEQRERELELNTRESEQAKAYQNGIEFIKKFCEDKPDEYEFIRLHNAYDDVLDLSAKYFAETGRYMNFDEAANHVEKHLEGEAEKLTQSKKLQAKFFPNANKEVSVEKNMLSNKTLSNAGVSSTPQETVDDEKILMQRAIASYRNGRAK